MYSDLTWQTFQRQWQNLRDGYRPGTPQYAAADKALNAIQAKNIPDFSDAQREYAGSRLPPAGTGGAGGGGGTPPPGTPPPGGTGTGPGPAAPGPSIGASSTGGAMAGLQSAAPAPVSVNVGGPSARSAALGQRTLPQLNPALSALKGMRLF